jgi:hypothetical protein
VEIEARAIALARERGETSLLPAFEDRMHLYERGEAYFESAPE